MSKIYKTREAFKLLSENPKLVFELEDPCLDIRRRLWRDDEYFMYGVIEKGSEKVLEYNLPNGYQFGGNISINDGWQIVREPVPAWEAIKAFCEGKGVSCKYKEFCEIEKEIVFNHNPHGGVGFTSHLLFNGKWYIND